MQGRPPGIGSRLYSNFIEYDLEFPGGGAIGHGLTMAPNEKVVFPDGKALSPKKYVAVQLYVGRDVQGKQAGFVEFRLPDHESIIGNIAIPEIEGLGDPKSSACQQAEQRTIALWK